MKRFTLVYFIILAMLMVGCNSPEFTSAKMYVNEGNLEKAEEFFLAALKVEPENALVPFLLAKHVYYEDGRWAEMADMFDEALQRNPDAQLEQFFSLDDGTRVTTVGQAIDIYRDQAWSKIYNEGVDVYRAGEKEEAAELFEVAVRVLPTNGTTYGTLASLYNELGRTNEALDLLKNAPEDCIVKQATGDIYLKLLDTEKAAESYRKSLDLCEDDGPILVKLIEVYIRMEKYDEALEVALKALDSYGNDPDIYFNVGVLYQQLAVDIYEPARIKFLEISQSADRDPGILLEIQNEFEDALNHFQEAKMYFYQSCDLEVNDSGACDAAKDTSKQASLLQDTLIPAVEEMRR